MRTDLRSRDVDARELMDDPDADRRMLARTYARFRPVNAVVSGWRGVYRRDIRPRARAGALRVLDIGCGGGDLARAVARRLRASGCRAEVTGLDPDPRAIEWASQADAAGLVHWRCASSAQLAEEGATFDVVLSNHVLHHLTSAELAALLEDSRRLTAPGGVVVHNDIARSPAAYRLYAAATRVLAGTLLADSFIRVDGLISIRRSYTPSELSAAVPPGWRVEKRMPARLLLRRESDAD